MRWALYLGVLGLVACSSTADDDTTTTTSSTPDTVTLSALSTTRSFEGQGQNEVLLTVMVRLDNQGSVKAPLAHANWTLEAEGEHQAEPASGCDDSGTVFVGSSEECSLSFIVDVRAVPTTITYNGPTTADASVPVAPAPPEACEQWSTLESPYAQCLQCATSCANSVQGCDNYMDCLSGTEDVCVCRDVAGPTCTSAIEQAKADDCFSACTPFCY